MISEHELSIKSELLRLRMNTSGESAPAMEMCIECFVAEPKKVYGLLRAEIARLIFSETDTVSSANDGITLNQLDWNSRGWTWWSVEFLSTGLRIRVAVYELIYSLSMLQELLKKLGCQRIVVW
jgi:hypothetical protein